MKKLFILALGVTCGVGLVLAWRKQAEADPEEEIANYYFFPCDAESRAARSRARISMMLVPGDWGL